MLLSISAIISSKIINVLRFLFGFHFSIFPWISFILFKYSIKTFESLKCFKPVLFFPNETLIFCLIRTLRTYISISSISGCLFIRPNNEFVLQIQSLRLLIFRSKVCDYWYSAWIIRNVRLIQIMFFMLSFCNIIKVNDIFRSFHYITTFNLFFFTYQVFTRSICRCFYWINLLHSLIIHWT